MGVMLPAATNKTLALNGDLYVDIPNYQTTGSKDKRIYDALVELGWSNVIV